MAHGIMQLNVRNPAVRILLVLLLLPAVVWSYFVVRWYLGNTIAEYFDPVQSSFDAAHLAVSMAPDDPLTHWRAAEVLARDFASGQQTRAIAEYENAVRLSPNDYRFWVSLGTAYERVGDTAKAEQALKRAVELAPSYSRPRWYLGNLFLRNGRYDEAFAELREASNAEPELQVQLFNLAWEVYSTDHDGMKKAIGASAEVRGAFALHLLSQKHYDEGLRLWNELTPAEKKANLQTAQEIIATLRKDFKFHHALKVWNDSAPNEYHADVGQIFDGGFEKQVSYGPEVVFGWQVINTSQTQIGIDSARSHSGSRSLKLVFQVRTNLEAVTVFELVPVAPRTEYEIEYYLTTDDLVSGRTPQVDVLDPTNNSVVVASPPAPSGTNRWNRVSFAFKTGENTEAVFLRLVRNSCATKETPICPIFGSVWYDDFSIKRRN